MSTLTLVMVKGNPKMQAILFNRKDVVGANQVLEMAGVVDRCPLVGGIFFDSLPRGSDLYLLARVLLNTELSDFLLPCKDPVANTVELIGSNYTP
jgi:hypothetical protein